MPWTYVGRLAFQVQEESFRFVDVDEVGSGDDEQVDGANMAKRVLRLSSQD